MTLDLRRLVYFSKNRISVSPPELSIEIQSILAISQANNALADITGALIFNLGIFAQVLEGSLSDVQKTFERIQRDARHGDVQVLSLDAVASRGFPNWSMGFVGRSLQSEIIFGRIGENTGFDAKRLEGDRVFQILLAIALDEEARAA